MRADIRQLRRPQPTARPLIPNWPPPAYADLYERPLPPLDAATQTRLAYEIHGDLEGIISQLDRRQPLPPMPKVATSGNCVTRWWDGLPWGEGDKSHDGKSAPALLCTKPAGHDDQHEAQGSKRQVVANLSVTVAVESANGHPPGGET